MSADNARPIAPLVLAEAAEWFAVLRGEDVTANDWRHWKQWLHADPIHRRAWARVERIEQRFQVLPAEPARAALGAAGDGRRRALKVLAGVAIGGPVLWQLVPVTEWRADYHTAVGEIREIKLADGTRAWLNTATALNVDYDRDRRRLKLLTGEILVETAPDPQPVPRPMLLETSQGAVQPLGTRFRVHDQQGRIAVSVYRGSVSVQPAGARPRVLGAGRQTRFTRNVVEAPTPVSRKFPDWQRRLLVANEMPLNVFLDEVGRYRRGYLGYDPAVSRLTLVGAYPLGDTERILDAVADTLPVRIRRITPWWVRIEPR